MEIEVTVGEKRSRNYNSSEYRLTIRNEVPSGEVPSGMMKAYKKSLEQIINEWFEENPP